VFHPTAPPTTPAPVAIVVPAPDPTPELSPAPAATPTGDPAADATPSPASSPDIVAVPASRTSGGGPPGTQVRNAAIDAALSAAGLALFVAVGVRLWQRRRRRRLLDG
jgi:hypothetical protein